MKRTSKMNHYYYRLKLPAEHVRHMQITTPGRSPAACGIWCPICCDVYYKHTKVLALPGCKHAFHVDCVQTWLVNYSASCPVCREMVTIAGCTCPGCKHNEVTAACRRQAESRMRRRLARLYARQSSSQ